MGTDIIESIKSATPLGTVLLLINAVGFALKSIKRLDHDLIPLILIPLGPLAALAILPNNDIPFECPYPWAYKLIAGVIIAAGSVGVHQFITKLKERGEPIEVKLAKLQTEIDELRAKKVEALTPPPS